MLLLSRIPRRVGWKRRSRKRWKGRLVVLRRLLVLLLLPLPYIQRRDSRSTRKVRKGCSRTVVAAAVADGAVGGKKILDERRRKTRRRSWIQIFAGGAEAAAAVDAAAGREAC